MYLTVALHTTVCPDTPDNWREFWRLKAARGEPGRVAVKKAGEDQPVNPPA
jgi:hypothetical protein